MADEPDLVEAETPEVEAEEQEIEQQEPELDDEGNPVEPEPEDEEVELGDVKLRVPKDAAQRVKDGWLRHDDYTRKTTELANQRKAFEAERGGFQQASQAEMQAQAQVLALDAQIAEYQRIDWDAWSAQAAANFDQDEKDRINESFRKFQQLKDARANAASQYVGLARQRASEAQQAIATRSEQTKAELAKIPGWSDAVETQVRDFGIKEYGFTADEMADMKIDSRIAKAFHRLHALEAQAKKATKAQATATKQEVQPSATVGRSNAPKPGVHDNLPIGEWMKREAARVARKRA